jgi:hypothetical protein
MPPTAKLAAVAAVPVFPLSLSAAFFLAAETSEMLM